jgi:hypothetical protein
MAIRLCITRVSHILKTSTTMLAAFLLALLLIPNSRAQSSGSTKWLATFVEGSGGQPAAVAIDSQGNVYVTGGDSVSSNYCPPPASCGQAVTIKYDPSGKVLWEDWLSTTSPGSAQGMDIVLDSAGNAYVLFNHTRPGANPNGSPIVPEVVTAKYNSSGGRDWINFIDSSKSGTVLRTPVAMAVSPAGNVYVTYEEDGPNANTATAITIKYDAAGHTIWSRTINDATGTNAESRPAAIGLDAHENIYVELYLTSTTDQNDGEIIKFDPSGTRLATFGRGQIGFAAGFHVDPDGASYFSGSAAGFEPDSIVVKFNSDQSLAYLVDITKLEGIGGAQGSGGGPHGGTRAIASDSAGDAFVLQHFDQTGPAATGEVISVLKLDPSGHELFVTRYNGQSDESGFDFPAALAVSPFGDIYVTGSSQLQPPSNLFQFVTIKYDNAGVRQWVAQYTGPRQFAEPRAMALSADNLIVTGLSFNSSGAEDWATIAYVP